MSPFIRRFRGVQTVEDYIDRLRAWIQPTVTAAPPPIPGSPFGLVAAVDYMDVVWRLKFGSPLVTLPGAERVAWLATEATSPAEFNGRLSALGEVLKGFVVPGAAKDGPLRRLEALLTRDLPAEAMVRVAPAIKVLDAVADVRNGGQHVGAMWDGRAVMALPSLGLTFPVVEHQAAWRTIQAYVIDALDTIRDEIRATV